MDTYNKYTIRTLLIRNSADKITASRQLTKLSGCFSFTFFIFKDGKKNLLLGESHNLEGICSDGYQIHRWLYDLIKNAPSQNGCTDLFVEDEFTDYFSSEEEYFNQNIENFTNIKDLFEYQSGMVAIQKTFKICKYAVLQKCPLPKLRYHFIDTRGYDPITKIFLNRHNYSDNWEKAEAYLSKHFIDIYLYCAGFHDNNNLINNYYKILIKGTGKTIKYLNQNNDRTQYLEFINKQLNKIKQPFDIERFFKILSESAKEFSMSNNFSRASTLLAVRMDVYFLLRWFHNYDIDKMDRGPVGCQDERATNSIVCGGDAHIEIYTNFFKKFFSIEPVIMIRNDPDNKCITLDKPFDFYA